MFLRIRRRFTYANVAVTLAVVFAMSGGAYAASRYVITSTKQISPKVLRALQGKAGAVGANGLAGAQGAAGAQGPVGPKGEAGSQGPAGPAGKNGENGTTGFTEKLPAGKTLQGEWSLIASVPGVGFEGVVATSVSFGIPLSKPPVPHLVRVGGKEAVLNAKGEEELVASVQCKGSAAEPTASAGNLCIYVSGELNAAKAGSAILPKICPFGAGEVVNCAKELEDATDRFGFGLLTIAENAGLVAVTGSWAVTAKE